MKMMSLGIPAVLLLLLAVVSAAYGFTWSEEQLDATNKHVNITESASLPCDFTLTQSETDQSNTFLLVTWSREKPADSGKWETITVMSNAYGRKTLKDGSRFVPDDSKYGLTITRAAREDHTQYKCTVHASFFTSPATVKLHVHFAPTNTSFTTSDIVSGRTLQMKCHADAYPPATYEFSRGSDYLLTSKEGVYQIGTHTEEDNGRYWCTPRNYLGRGPSRFIDLPNEGDFSSRDDSNKDGVKLSEKMLYIIIALLAALCLIFVVGIILWALCRKRGVKDDSDSGQTRRGRQDDTQEAHENYGDPPPTYDATQTTSLASQGPQTSERSVAPQEPQTTPRSAYTYTNTNILQTQDTQAREHKNCGMVHRGMSTDTGQQPQGSQNLSRMNHATIEGSPQGFQNSVEEIPLGEINQGLSTSADDLPQGTQASWDDGEPSQSNQASTT
ncbi:coxsackievirus and adenovirus receptor [Nematostella vectensis]|uniref:coxsackievirus and adenovirus receptor n=1 Tax=Nematostella vectensis TaxID=45351 RepID=UPI00207774E1|nr:coxsackievirus and adenovirus receptor [Nematostella vectensis]XP_032235923.2 coxsackievirus and adenovirus receptor [Nematostella vectensis]XP_032235924.2 coxsackievirus and adenovirus receptor [Nematostella vectensis]